MKNIRIVALDDHSIVVKADSERFGKDAIMYQDTTFMRCCDYIRRVTRTDHFRLQSLSCVPSFTDRDGRTMPMILEVCMVDQPCAR